MARNSVDQWSTTANDNTDIAGININEGCPPSGINNAIRTMMAQIKSGVALVTGFVMTGPITDMGSGSTVKDPSGTARPVGFRNIPSVAKTAAYTLALGDAGECIDITTGGVTVPPNSTVAFAVGDTINIYNKSGTAQTITQGVGVTLRRVATTSTGNRSLTGYGYAFLRKVDTDEWIVGGAGLS